MSTSAIMRMAGASCMSARVAASAAAALATLLDKLSCTDNLRIMRTVRIESAAKLLLVVLWALSAWKSLFSAQQLCSTQH